MKNILMKLKIPCSTIILTSVLLPLCAEAQGILIDPTTLNGSFENNSSKTTFDSGLVPNWVVWTGVSAASNDSGTDASGAATQGTRDAYLQGGNADFDLTSYTFQAGDVFTYTWDWALVGRGSATAQLGYWNGSIVVAIAGTDTSFQSNSSQGLGLGTTYTVLPGDPAIGNEIAMTILAPSGSNYPEVDNFVLTVTPVPEPSVAALGGLGGLGGILLLLKRNGFSS
jgi:hypothetical protein